MLRPMEIINIIAALICCWRRRGAADVAQYALPDRACLTFSCSKVSPPHFLFVTFLLNLSSLFFMELFRDRGGVLSCSHVLPTYLQSPYLRKYSVRHFYNFGQPSRGARLQSTGPQVGTGSTLVIIVWPFWGKFHGFGWQNDRNTREAQVDASKVPSALKFWLWWACRTRRSAGLGPPPWSSGTEWD